MGAPPRTSVRVGVVDDRALGTPVRLVVTRPGSVAAAKAALDSVLVRIDATCSRFRDDSELTRLNASPDQDVTVSPLLAAALAAALRAARLSEGAVDPTVGEAVRLAGYDVDFASVPADGAPIRLSVVPVPGWRQVRFDMGRRIVRLPVGIELDLGATAKALASDMAAGAALRAAGGGGALVSLGGDVAVAGEAPAGGWLVQAAEDSAAPVAPDAETVAVFSGGLATSSITVRRWTRGGVELHHIVDPSTGRPADGPWRTASVLARSCVDANIASTAAIVRGDGAPRWLGALGLPSRLVDREGRVVRVAGWPEPGSRHRSGRPDDGRLGMGA